MFIVILVAAAAIARPIVSAMRAAFVASRTTDGRATRTGVLGRAETCNRVFLASKINRRRYDDGCSKRCEPSSSSGVAHIIRVLRARRLISPSSSIMSHTIPCTAYKREEAKRCIAFVVIAPWSPLPSSR